MVATQMGGDLMPSKPLQASDLIVEYRDKNLIRRGSIPQDDLLLKIQPVFNGVGAWSLQLPAEHRAVPYLRAPGAGIIVTNHSTGEIVMSGSTSKPTKRSTAAEPRGMATIAGLSDDRLVWDALAYPEPLDANVTTQGVSHDVRTGSGEDLLRQYVAYNICYTHAPAGRLGGLRNFLHLEAASAGLGTTLTKRARFAVLGDLLKEIAIESGGLGFRIVQVGAELEFQVYQPTDRSAFIRLDVANGTLNEQSVEFAPPEVTRIVVAGQGEGVDRQFVSVTTPDATTAEGDWGLIIEEFKDQRQTDVTAELTGAGLGDLAERGFTKVAVKASPANDQTMVYMQDFGLGDKVTIVIDGQEATSYITEAALVVDKNGISTAVAIGDIADFDRDSALRQDVQDNTKRLDNLERNAEATPPTVIPPQQLAMTGEMKIWPTATAPSGWALCQGQALNRTTYAELFDLIGTTFGSGDGSTTFNLPNLKGRAIVGQDSAQSEFNTMGETGGTKTHTLTTAEMPSHTHTQNSHTHTQNSHSHTGMNIAGAAISWQAAGQSGTNKSGIFAGGTGSDPSTSATTATNQSTTATNQNTGGGGAHNNLQPYITLNYIIKL